MPIGMTIWPFVAAFGTYFCMYAFRKPFSAAAYQDASIWGIQEKTLLVSAQVLGYASSKILGIRVISETPPRHRAAGIIGLIGAAELTLLLFGLAPRPLRPFCLLLNGLSLGLVFGLVLGFLEGRRVTEVLTAGLCASFIIADGVTRSLGSWLLLRGVTESWMPGVAGLLFLLPLLLFVWMLSITPAADQEDIAQRGERHEMGRVERLALIRRYGVGLTAIVLAYFVVTVARSIRADFAPEIWRGLGVEVVPSIFALSEVVVALVVLMINGLAVLILDNRRAFFASIGISLSGAVLMFTTLVVHSFAFLDGFSFMVLMGCGIYLPYVAIQTTIFERLLAMTRVRGNVGFLMYFADSAGYIGYMALMIVRSTAPSVADFLWFFKAASWATSTITCANLLIVCWYFSRPAQTVDQSRA